LREQRIDIVGERIGHRGFEILATISTEKARRTKGYVYMLRAALEDVFRHRDVHRKFTIDHAHRPRTDAGNDAIEYEHCPNSPPAFLDLKRTLKVGGKPS
jgi:hypothetical protein